MIRQRPIFAIFIFFYLYFFLGGTLSYRLANYFWFAYYDFNYQVDFTLPIIYAAIGLLSFLLAYFTFEKVSFSFTGASMISSKQNRIHNITHLLSLGFLFFIGTIGFLLIVAQYGGKIPLLSDNSDEFRTKITSGLPQVLYFQLVLSAVLAYTMISRAISRAIRNMALLIMAVSLGLILMGGSRSMFLTPVLVILIDIWRRKALRIRYIILFSTAAMLVWFMVGIMRLGIELGWENMVLRMATDFAPEFREFAKLMQFIPDKVGYLNGQMFSNALYIFVPGGILEPMGVIKSIDWVPFGEFLKNLFGYEFAGGGLRAGLIAEFFANFGLPGIIGGFYILGIFIKYFDSKLRRASREKGIFYLLIGLSLGSSVLFTFDAVTYKILSLLFGWIIFKSVLFCLQNPAYQSNKIAIIASRLAADNSTIEFNHET